MTELRQNGTRFRVVELEGWEITGQARSGPHAGLTVAVLDSAYSWREVRTFATGLHKGFSQAHCRTKAADLADELNLQDRLAS